MASIRICTATLAALEPTSINGFSEPFVGSSESNIENRAISIPSEPYKLTRRVSFNLGGNSVLELPSNTVMSKISRARTRRHSGLASSLESADGQSADELAKQIDRQACAMLPHGASPELLDPRCTLTALCVQRGHIRPMKSASQLGGVDESLDEHASDTLPIKGVLKPYAPSPVNTEFLLNGVPESMQFDLSDDEDELTPKTKEESGQSKEPKPKRAGRKKKSHAKPGTVSKSKRRQKRAAGKSRAAVELSSAVPLPRPIPIST
ncbi:hypothetical protein IWW36_001760 [Coemansia brasiliensis]|uniref:Uncharacterized protein n=1 Tax=Coemansia brasiliensis TaxID=2650707 RepID=A0A9W8M1P3_9FUNG|nr:hypothetical protein IWW36_001760 [Coemansia brasiliensis]